MNDNSVNLITLILSIGSVISPILFGYLIWKMSQIFVSKEEFTNYKQSVAKEQDVINERLKKIEENTIELLQRTANLRKD